MDFIEGLPLSSKQNVILVVIDKFTKYAHFMALAHPFTALQVAQLYLNTVYKLHGLPEAIISDQDRIFTSSVWQELFRLSNTQLLMSSSYRDGTRGCGCGFGKNPPAGKPTGLGKTRPQVDPRVHFCTRTRTRRVSGGFRVPAGLAIAGRRFARRAPGRDA